MPGLPSRALIAGVAGVWLLAGPAAAQDFGGGGLSGGQSYTGGVLPGLSNTRSGDLRPQLERYFRTASLPPTAPAWVINPGIGVDIGATDNRLHGSSPRRGDIFTIISPYVSVTSDSVRFKTNLSYSPQIQVYANQSNQNRVSQSFDGQSLVTIVPDAVFVDFRGTISQTSLTGAGNNGTNNQTTANYSRQNEVQTTSFSVTPYAEHRFGGWGTGRLGYSFARTLQDNAGSGVNTNGFNNNAFNNNNFNNSNFNNNGFNANGQLTPGYGSVGNLSTQRERASFVTGENLGRVNNMLVLEAIQYSGGGSYRNAHRNQFNNEVGYALTRRITLLGGFGYQDVLYSGSPNIRINEPSWNGGVRYSTSPDTTITVLYGRRDANTSASLDGQFAPTNRTRVIARYSTGVTSDVEDAQTLLNTTSVGPGGLLVDSNTGAPVGNGSGSLGVQNGVFKVKRFSVTGLLLGARDSYSVTLNSEDRTTLSNTTSVFTNGVIPTGTNSSSLSASLAWQHELSPGLSSSLSVNYGTSNNTSQFINVVNGQQTFYGASAALSKQFTQTFSGSVRYSYNERSGGTVVSTRGLNSGDYSENVLLVGFRKGF